jgi:hypothetical protein
MNHVTLQSPPHVKPEAAKSAAIVAVPEDGSSRPGSGVVGAVSEASADLVA